MTSSLNENCGQTIFRAADILMIAEVYVSGARKKRQTSIIDGCFREVQISGTLLTSQSDYMLLEEHFI